MPGQRQLLCSFLLACLVASAAAQGAWKIGGCRCTAFPLCPRSVQWQHGVKASDLRNAVQGEQLTTASQGTSGASTTALAPTHTSGRMWCAGPADSILSCLCLQHGLAPLKPVTGGQAWPSLLLSSCRVLAGMQLP